MWFIVLAVLALVFLVSQSAQGQSLLGLTGMGTPSSFSGAVQNVAQGIARAEGFYVPGALPARYNNPGDITDASTGLKIQYPDVATGWSALYQKIQNDIGSYGNSQIYSPDMTWRAFGWMWVCGTAPDDPSCTQSPDNWVSVVCTEIGTSPGDRCGDYFGV